jgi:hypothetical protein
MDTTKNAYLLPKRIEWRDGSYAGVSPVPEAGSLPCEFWVMINGVPYVLYETPGYYVFIPACVGTIVVDDSGNVTPDVPGTIVIPNDPEGEGGTVDPPTVPVVPPPDIWIVLPPPGGTYAEGILGCGCGQYPFPYYFHEPAFPYATLTISGAVSGSIFVPSNPNNERTVISNTPLADGFYDVRCVGGDNNVVHLLGLIGSPAYEIAWGLPIAGTIDDLNLFDAEIGSRFTARMFGPFPTTSTGYIPLYNVSGSYYSFPAGSYIVVTEYLPEYNTGIDFRYDAYGYTGLPKGKWSGWFFSNYSAAHAFLIEAQGGV